MSDKKRKKIFGRIASFAIVAMLMASLAIVHNRSLMGHSLSADAAMGNDTVAPVERAGESMVINTSDLGKSISGYAGPVPLEIYVTDGVIDSVVVLPNHESPGFFRRLYSEGLPSKWNGMTLDSAASLQVDAVSGATYSSTAFIANVHAGIDFAIGHGDTNHFPCPSAAQIAAFVVVLAGALLPLFVKGKWMRTALQVVNVGVLGFWAGTFIDYAMMLHFVSSAPRFSLAFLTTVVLLVVGFIYPVFGKSNYYCTWICPYGAMQELAGKVSGRKIKISKKVVIWLDRFRQILWVLLLLSLFGGMFTGWIDNEIFTAFMVESASWIVITAGVIFIILSVFINRPFCRFVCPTGSLLKEI